MAANQCGALHILFTKTILVMAVKLAGGIKQGSKRGVGNSLFALVRIQLIIAAVKLSRWQGLKNTL